MSQIITINEQSFEEVTSHGVVVVDFYADWCQPCKMMAGIFAETSDQYVGKVTFAKINTDENQAVSIANRIMSIPTIFFYKDGQLIERVSGVIDQATLSEKLDALI